jgi:endonuclease/exonuclease/phosphatase family metal-dependent hydrolase
VGTPYWLRRTALIAHDDQMINQAVRPVALLVSVLLLLAACSSTSTQESEEGTEQAAETSLNLMQFNIEYGGDSVDFESVAKAIEAADADVVAIQEGYAKMPAIASDLGWEYYDARTQTVSKYPLLTDDELEYGIYVELEGGLAAVFNLHLPSTAYGPNKVNAGATPEEVLEREERGRLRALEPILAEATTQMEQGIPTFVLGDFNAPSHHDWTEQTVGLREHVRYPLEWPTSTAAEEIGLVDVYRSVHPDPVEKPGLTWPADRPFVQGYNPADAGKPADRIDLMFVGGPAHVQSVSMVGEGGSEYTDIAVDPWPTDHRALVATFDVTPGAPLSVVSVDQRLVEIGDGTAARYFTRTDDAAALAVVPVGGTSDEAVAEAPAAGSRQGEWVIPSGELEPGSYDLLLLAANRELARTTFWLTEPGTKTEVTTDKTEYSAGDPIEVSWALAPGNKWDWIGIYKQGADPNVAYYKLWAYTDATVAGSFTFDDEGGTGTWPLPAGDYSAYLLADDSYTKLGGADFSITR